jgi:DNA-binding transcriptional LysR family regulator
VKEAGSREIEADVISERLELGIVTLPVQTGEVRVRPLREDRIVPIVAQGHPLAATKRVRASQLSGHGVVGFEAGSAIRELIDSALRTAGVDLNIVMELRSIPAIVRMVMATGNLAFVSALGVGDDAGVCRLKVQGLRISRRLAIISKREGPLSTAASAFADQLARRGVSS